MPMARQILQSSATLKAVRRKVCIPEAAPCNPFAGPAPLPSRGRWSLGSAAAWGPTYIGRKAPLAGLRANRWPPSIRHYLRTCLEDSTKVKGGLHQNDAGPPRPNELELPPPSPGRIFRTFKWRGINACE